MKRLLALLLGFWLLLATVLVVVVVFSEDTPAPKEKPPGPMTCASLQKRAERCADELADFGGELYAAHLRDQGESDFAINAKVPIAATLVFGAITDKKVAHYCKLYWKSDTKRIRQARASLAKCFARPGCEAFVDCLRSRMKRFDFTSF